MDEPELEGPKGFKSRCHAYLTPVYNAPVGVSVIPLDVTEFDPLGEFNLALNRFVARRRGFYLINGSVYFTHVNAATQVFMLIVQNGALSQCEDGAEPPTPINNYYMNSTTISHLEGGDFIELWVNNLGPAALPIIGLGGREWTFLDVQRVS